jgi:nucleoside-diphosphate-sugar epimerase
MKVLLLGSNGFIGKALGTKLEVQYDLVKVNRETDLENLFKSDQIFDFIINCASSSSNADSEESHASNFLYPMKFFNNLRSMHWVQIESYFQLQITWGRNDSYTIEKEKFSKYLDAGMRSRSAPLIHHLYLPHIFGEGDRPERLISSVISSFKGGRDFLTSSGTQFLPLLHISDAVTGIIRFIESPTSRAACIPFWYGSVRELIDLISSQFSDPRVQYGLRPDPLDSSFPRVQFPKCVNGWKPKMQLNEFLEWVGVQHG